MRDQKTVGGLSLVPASPEVLLNAFKAHLFPRPCFSSLPTALTIFANFQLLSDRLKSHAHRALQVNNDVTHEFSAQGLSQEEREYQGVLAVKEVKCLKRIMKRDEGMMYIFSSEIRRHHLAMCLSTPRVDIKRIRQLIDTYFPDLTSAPTSQAKHAQLYIRILEPGHIRSVESYRAWALECLGEYARTTALGERPLSYGRLVARHSPPTTEELSVTTGEKTPVLCRNLMKEAEAVFGDMQEFETIFAAPLLESEMDHTRIGGDDQTIGMQTAARVKQRKLNGVRAKGNAEAGPSRLTAQPMTSISPAKPIPASNSSPVRATSNDVDPSSKPLTVDPPQNPVQVSPVRKVSQAKRPRMSASHLTPIGPDYTAPIAKPSSNVPNGGLRPFDNSQLKRPRASLPANLNGSAGHPNKRPKMSIDHDGRPGSPPRSEPRYKGKQKEVAIEISD